MTFEVLGGLPEFWSDNSMPSSSAAFNVVMVLFSFWSDNCVLSSRVAFDLGALEDLRVALPVTAAAMLLVALSTLSRTSLATAGVVG